MSNLYAERDIIGQGNHYSRHTSAMTGEGLHSKSAIAAELAHRDIQIDQLRQQLEQAEARVAELTEALEGIRYCHPHDEGRYIDKACEVLDENFSGHAWLLRKQADKVERGG